MSDGSHELEIDYFFGDANVQRLVNSTAVWEPLRICYPKEVSVSRFLAWLLDPTQGHGLGDLAIQSLLTRCWWCSDEVDIDLARRRFIAPSNVQTESFSSVVVTTEVDLDGTSLDVLVVDPSRRRYIAIENKFGAQQSAAQLSGYRSKLEELLDGFLGIHVLLDTNGAEPDDKAWIAVGYDWLAEFLREVELRPATAEHVRQVLGQFRSAIEDETEDTMGKSAHGRLITEVANGHPEVLKMMAAWSRVSKGGRTKTLVSLLDEATTLEGKSNLRLFQLYWRRSSVWDQCIKQMQFAPFVSALRQRFNDLCVDPKRVRTGFSLEQWDTLIDTEQFDDGWFCAAGVNVRQYNETFQVTAFINLQNVHADKRDAFIAAASALRKEKGIKRAMSDEQSFVVLKRMKDLNKTKAVQETVALLSELQAAFAVIR